MMVHIILTILFIGLWEGFPKRIRSQGNDCVSDYYETEYFMMKLYDIYKNVYFYNDLL